MHHEAAMASLDLTASICKKTYGKSV
jgi:hypothetical protein